MCCVWVLFVSSYQARIDAGAGAHKRGDGGVLRGAAAAPAIKPGGVGVGRGARKEAPRPRGGLLAHRGGDDGGNVRERCVLPHDNRPVGARRWGEGDGDHAGAGLGSARPAVGGGCGKGALDGGGGGRGVCARGLEAYFLDAGGGAHRRERRGPQAQHRPPASQRFGKLGPSHQRQGLVDGSGLCDVAPAMTTPGGQLKGARGFRLPFGAWHVVLAVCHLGTATAIIVHALATDRRWAVPVDVLYNQWETSLTEGGDECGGDAGPCIVTLHRRRLARSLAVWLVVPFFSVVSGLHHAAAAGSLFGAGGPAPERRVWAAVTWFKLTSLLGTKTAVALSPRRPPPASAAGWYAASVIDGVVWVRWADYAVSATLMLLVNAVLWVSPPDLQTLVLWAAVQVLIIAAGAGSEVAASAGRHGAARVLFWSAVAPFAGVWAAQLYVFYVAVDADTGADPPAVVYLFLFGLLAGFSAFPIVHGLKLRALRAAGADAGARLAANLKSEARYAGLSFSVKFPLLLAYWAGNVNRDATTVFGFGDLRGSGSGNAGGNATGTTPGSTDDTDTAVFIAFGIGAAIALALDALLLYASPPRPGDLRGGATAAGNSFELTQTLL